MVRVPMGVLCDDADVYRLDYLLCTGEMLRGNYRNWCNLLPRRIADSTAENSPNSDDGCAQRKRVAYNISKGKYTIRG